MRRDLEENLALLALIAITFLLGAITGALVTSG